MRHKVQLRAELERFWPAPAGPFSALDSPISLAFLKRYPSRQDAGTLGLKRMTAFLAEHSYSGRKTPAQLLTKLRNAPEGRAGEAEIGARRQLVLTLIAALRADLAATGGEVGNSGKFDTSTT